METKKYTSQAISDNILSVLNVQDSGSVVTAETWKALWGLVITGINHIDGYCADISELITDWQEAAEELKNLAEDTDAKYNSLAASFIHVGSDAPENENIRLWMQPSADANLKHTSFLKDTDYATTSKAGIVKVPLGYGLKIFSGGSLHIDAAGPAEIKARTNNRPITCDQIKYLFKYGLPDQNISFTDSEKKVIKKILGITDTVDQTYYPESEHAQSGKAVAKALETITNAVRVTSPSLQIKLHTLDISPIEHELKIICTSTTDKVFIHGEDLIETATVYEGYGITGSGGMYTNDVLACTDYIKINASKDFMIRWGKSRWIAFYDKNKNVITAYNPLTDDNIVNSMCTAPVNAAYVRVTFDKIERGQCNLYEGELYSPNAKRIVEGVMSTKAYTPYTIITSIYAQRIQLEYNTIVNERLETAIAGNSGQIARANADNSTQFANVFNLLNAIQTMSIDVDRPTGNTITVEPETVYILDSGSNDNLISFTQDSDDNKHTGRIILMVLGKEYAYQDKYTLAYVVTAEKGLLTPTTGMWSFYARRKDGYNTKITFPDGSSLVKIKNVVGGE